jgi:hypothetical protein
MFCKPATNSRTRFGRGAWEQRRLPRFREFSSDVAAEDAEIAEVAGKSISEDIIR